jgi:predicted nucleotidyltransferase
MSAETQKAQFAIPFSTDRIAAFCAKWKLSKLELFGSVLRDDFRQDSDVDVLVTFGSDAGPTFLGIFEMKDELQEIFCRPVDLLTRESIEASRNPYRRKAIMESAMVVYAN